MRSSNSPRRGEREDALDGLARYCVAEASRAVAGLMGPAQAEWLDRVRDDLENYRAALVWLIEGGRSSEASDIAFGLLWFWAIRGHAIEGLRWYEQILDLPSLAPRAESTALLGAAGMRYIQGEFERARTDLRRALALARGAADIGSVAHAEFVLGHVEYAVGNLDAAGEHFARSLEMFKSAGTAWGTAQVLSAMAWVALAKGRPEVSERLLDEATSALQHSGPWFRLLPLHIRAVLAVQRGNPDEAIALARESLTHIRTLQDKWNFLYTAVPLAAAAALKGDDAWVARILGARDTVSKTTGAAIVDASVHGLQESVERDARARLGPDRWARAYQAGRRTSIDDLLTDIDRALSATT